MSMYRVFRVEDNGHISGDPERIDAVDDAAAIRLASGLLRDHSLELWVGSRYLTTLTRNPATGHADWIIVARDEK